MKNEAKVYVTSTCPYCTMMKNYLTEQNIPFQTINVQENQEEARRLVAKTGHTGVPQTQINGKWVLGFDPDAVQEILGA
ncbi:glutaredoxin family protein [Ornithinibacillus halophilus]|uniref:Glutaredoxin-like protein, YruB-family n=1 Tax=Ornithinibacillus halophilus TaxID=930117 RepID=A0A1M5J8Z1_9BACI|nr:glutaredoxin family protein [Ornithinibacillus halophilus]SHG36473.1 Glutaredoxin-like protein, YruB-family [Ornithinibacillus halophilus]